MTETALNIEILVIPRALKLLCGGAEIYLPCEIRSNFCKAKITSQGKYFGACNLLFYKKYLSMSPNGMERKIAFPISSSITK